MKASLLLYIKHYFDFTSRTSRPHYWWAIGTIYVVTTILGTLSALIRFPLIMPLWLGLNIIPLLTLTVRRLRDVGFNNQALLWGGLLYLALFCTLAWQPNHSAVAFGIEILTLVIVLLPLLKTDELTTKSQNKVMTFLLRQS